MFHVGTERFALDALAIVAQRCSGVVSCDARQSSALGKYTIPEMIRFGQQSRGKTSLAAPFVE